MAKSAMPFLIVNYGSEMIFILDQRLQAQSVTPEKSGKVLHDVVRAMFAPAFVEELMRPQDLYNAAATKEIFDRLAHSSIMRLSENSMDKLYDLMTMGCKYQLFCLRHPRELVELTLNHVDSVRSALNAQQAESLALVESRFRATFANVTYGQLMDARHALLNFFQGRRVKVSLFLQEGMQNPDSTFNLPAQPVLLPDPLQEAPGVIRYFDQGKMVLEESAPFPVDVVRPVQSSRAPSQWDTFTSGQRECTMGSNLYLADKRKKLTSSSVQQKAPAVPSAPSPPKVQAASATREDSSNASIPVAVPSSSFQRSQQSSSGSYAAGLSATTGALNFLSQLIAPPPVSDHFKLNLFDDDSSSPSASAGAYAGGCPPSDEPTIQIKRISREEMIQSNQELAGLISGFQPAGGAKGGAGAHGGDDLLDLLDAAGS